MKKNRKNRTFVRNTPSVSTVFNTVNGGKLSHCVKGMSQPPKNSDVMSALAVTMFAYSAMKKSENFIAEYSVWRRREEGCLRTAPGTRCPHRVSSPRHERQRLAHVGLLDPRQAANAEGLPRPLRDRL